METPCIKICKLKDGVCYGCGRTTTEIANWSRYTTEERSKIIGRLSTVYPQKSVRSLYAK